MKIRLTNYYRNSPIRVLHYLHYMSERKQLHTVAIDMETYSKLKNLGYTGESFNTVIKRLIRLVNQHDARNAHRGLGTEV
jgi:hypothetical protein